MTPRIRTRVAHKPFSIEETEFFYKYVILSQKEIVENITLHAFEANVKYEKERKMTISNYFLLVNIMIHVYLEQMLR